MNSIRNLIVSMLMRWAHSIAPDDIHGRIAKAAIEQYAAKSLLVDMKEPQS